MARAYSLVRLLVAIVLLLGAATSPSLAASKPAQRLFTNAERGSTTSASMAAVAESAVSIDFQAFESPRLAIDLPDGSSIEAGRSKLERRSDGGLTWFGRVVEGDGEVVLTMKNGYVSGLIYGPQGVYQIIPQADGAHRLVELDHSLFPECGGAVEPLALLAPVAGNLPPQTHADPFDRIEVMVLYTPQARTAAGGVAQVETIAQNAVDITNVAYGNSQVVPRMYLVHTAEATRNDSGNMGADLSWVASDAGVAMLRNTHAADMVSLLVNSGGACGIGFVQRNPGPGFASSAFQVTALSCAVGNLSFAHELGHNMGCEHNPENSDAWPAGGSFLWSYGDWHSGSYRTVMSYSNPCSGGCTRHPYFSNSNVSFLGLPTGVLDLRENYRTINSTAEYVSNFRESGFLFEDGFESGDASAWSGVE